ncbi:MAG: orotate phosphoribosyltransferase [Actinomycetota bacterium]|nr:orotate phosphoribosyltransferase [Actinomycetota bacterium]
MTVDASRFLAEHGAVLRGHFKLSSGRHSDTYVEKARVLEHPHAVVDLAREIASWYQRVEVVVSPAVGAIPLGFAVALAGSARFVYAERVNGAMALRRGFRLGPGERVLVVEDVITTGGSASEVHDLVRTAGAEALGVAALVDRSTGDVPFPLRALATVRAETFDPAACPLCARGMPVEAPGSRHLGKETEPPASNPSA